MNVENKKEKEGGGHSVPPFSRRDHHILTIPWCGIFLLFRLLNTFQPFPPDDDEDDTDDINGCRFELSYENGEQN